MGRMLLFLIIGMSTLFSIATLDMNYSNSRLINNSVEKYEKIQARNIACSGISMAVSKLYSDTAWTGIDSLVIAGGKLNISITSTNSQYPNGPDMSLTGMKQINSTGIINSQSVTISSVVQLPVTASPPPFLEYAIASGRDLHMQGSISVVDDGNNTWNANVHTNAELSTQGNAYRVEGFGTYSGSLSSNKNQFHPNVNPNNDPVNSQVSPITIPDFDPSAYSSIATNVTNGDLTLNGTTSLGTEENPVIWLVNGNLNFRGTTSGYGVFIVTGNIQFNGNVSMESVDPTGSNIGFYAGGNIESHGNISLAGQLFAAGDIQANGNFTLRGSMTAKNNVQLQGNPTIRYRPANAALTNQFWPTSTNARPVVVSYYE